MKKSRVSSSSSVKGLLYRILLYAGAAALCLLVLWVLWLDYRVREKFDGRKWAIPAEVYASPLVLFDGARITESDLRLHLKHLAYRPVEAVTRQGQWSLHGRSVNVYIRSHRIGQQDYPARRVRFELVDGQVVKLSVEDGEPSAMVSLEPVLIGRIYPLLAEDRELVQLSDVPALLGEMLIAVEDRQFVDHVGVSPTAIARAAWQNLRAGKVVQGGSTLTQQLVKNFYLSHDRRISRKLKEAIMSLLLEWHYSKSEILETYMNEVYLGQARGHQIHGFALAARHYFDSDVKDLSADQIALLVGMVKGASFYNPRKHPERAKQRRDLVLKVAAQEGLLNDRQLQVALARPLGVIAQKEQTNVEHPAFIQLVKRQLMSEYQRDELEEEGLSIYTTLSLVTQAAVERQVERQLGRIEKAYGIASDSLQTAAVVTAVGSGEIEALVGGRDARFKGFNRALDARRQIGSLIKPALYLAALSPEGGKNLASLISDEPVTVEQADGRQWQPENFDRQSHGDVLLIDALANSWNQASVRLGLEVGLESVRQKVSQLGVEVDIPPFPSSFLGAFEMTPMQVSQMYHTLANDGVVVPLRAIRQVVDRHGVELSRYRLRLKDGLASADAHLIQFALQTAMREGTGKSVYQHLPDNLLVAGKTGTSSGQRDSWFAGFSGDHVGVFWVGKDDNGETPLTGATGAMPLWRDTLLDIRTRGLSFVSDDQIRYRWVDSVTGGLSGENCHGARLMPFRMGSEPISRAKCERIRNPVLHWLEKWM